MARMRVFIVFALAIGVGSVFAFATYNYVQTAAGRSAQIETTPVVVASANLDVGTEIDRDDIHVVDWPAGALPEGAFNTVDESSAAA